MSTRVKILKATESRIREGGYSNVSHREIGVEVGIKSSSVHYHFDTKESLVAEVTRNYTDSFIEILGEPQDIINAHNNPLLKYIQLFKLSLIEKRGMCLCALLGAESNELPLKVKEELKRFFTLNINWLEKSFLLLNPDKGLDAVNSAIETIALVEGAMMMSITMEDVSIFDHAMAKIIQDNQPVAPI